MMIVPNIFIPIEPDKEYIPEKNNSVIFQIHCIKTNECSVRIWSFSNTSGVDFPPGSFIQGAVYTMVIYKMKFDVEKAGFIGMASENNQIPNAMPKGWLSDYYNRKQINNGI